jgi:KipI family sensor histidine kinase inhibitor
VVERARPGDTAPDEEHPACAPSWRASTPVTPPASRDAPGRTGATPPLQDPVEVRPLGDAWVMVDWGAHRRANVAARALAARLRGQPRPFCVEAVAGVRTLAVRIATDEALATRAAHREAALGWLRDMAPLALHWEAPAGREVVLPACYDESMAPDLREVAERTGLSTSAVADLHAGCVFIAEVVGFMPGFAYLGGLDPRLAVDRRASPRPLVPEGSIAIAGLQAAVYPSATPGGWSLIGRCPVRLFDPSRSPPAVMGEGDTVRFEPIDRAAFERLWSAR